MVLDAVSNFVRGNTDAEVGTDDTTVSVADASIFPDPATDGEFNVVIWDVNNFPRPDQDADVEIMRVTARDTTADELTVSRGQETTSAATHPEGSAIHLSPTAKMFGDIESTFGDFWDAGTQELTGDVNNTNTTTQALEADTATTETLEANRPLFADDPPGALVRIQGDATIPDDTITRIPWEDSFRDAENLLDTDNNVIVVPDYATFAKINFNLFFDSQIDFSIIRTRKNDSGHDGQAEIREISGRSINASSGWVSVDGGDEISLEILQRTGESATLADVGATRLEVYLK